MGKPHQHLPKSLTKTKPNRTKSRTKIKPNWSIYKILNEKTQILQPLILQKVLSSEFFQETEYNTQQTLQTLAQHATRAQGRYHKPKPNLKNMLGWLLRISFSSSYVDSSTPWWPHSTLTNFITLLQGFFSWQSRIGNTLSPYKINSITTQSP